MMRRQKLGTATLGIIAAMATTATSAAPIQIKFENLAPDGGTFLTPLWVAAHNDQFDLFEPGQAASAGLEMLAEDGVVSGLDAELGANGQAAVILAPGGFPGAPVFDPDEEATILMNVADAMTQRWLSFASMLIPSNDAFVGSPAGIEIFDAAGNFTGKQIITILGSQVWDAGTELNDEMDAAFLNQMAPNTGTSTPGDVIGLHPGFIGAFGGPAGTPMILGGTNGAGIFFDPVAADFTLPNAVVARITITPEPTSLGLLAAGAAGLLLRRRRTA